MTNKEYREGYIKDAIDERERQLVHFDYMRQYYLTEGAKSSLGSDNAEAAVKQLLMKTAETEDQLRFFKGLKVDD
mgnify:CR=1 FL=1